MGCLRQEFHRSQLRFRRALEYQRSANASDQSLSESASERQKEEAIHFAQSVKQQNTEMERRLSKVDNSYVSEFESRDKTEIKKR